MFKKGQSGNPSGRPKVNGTLRDLARAHTATALNTLVAIMKDTEAGAAARVSASATILDRGWGKAVQPHDGDGEGGPIKHVCEWLPTT